MAVLVAVMVTLIFVMIFDVVRQQREVDGGLQPSSGGRWVALALVPLIAVRRRVAGRDPQQSELGDSRE